MRDLKVTLVQAELAWHDIGKNLEEFERRIGSIKGDTDLVVLPEMFSTGFTMEPRGFAEAPGGRAQEMMSGWARRLGACVTGSVIAEENGCYFNRLVWARPDGSRITCDKRHLFRMAGEEKIYCGGSGLITEDVGGWSIRPFICYDLRFPVWMRNKNNEYDIAVVVANWPEKRAEHWRTLLRARAIENLCYVIGVNRVGVDGNGHSYSGDSAVIDFAGKVLFEKSGAQCVQTVSLSADALREYRGSFPAWKDADRFTLVD